VSFFPFFWLPFFRKFPRSPLKRRLRRAFWPPGPPKAVPRSTRGLPRRSRFHLSVQMLVLFCVFEKNENVTATFLFFRERLRFFFTFRLRRVSSKHPGYPLALPADSQRLPKPPQEAPKRSRSRSTRAQRPPKAVPIHFSSGRVPTQLLVSEIRNRRKQVENKSQQRSSTVVTRIGRAHDRKHFRNGRTLRVAAVVARSAQIRIKVSFNKII